MSKFTSYFPFGQIGDEETYLGLSPDSEDGIVINTLDQNMILRIELNNNNKQARSWKTEQKLSHKVVYDSESKKYVGVFGKRQLRYWEVDQEIKKDKIKLRKTVNEIISFDGKHTILVYTDGTCESIKNASKAHSKDVPPIINEQTHKITNIACFHTSDNHVMLTYFIRSKHTPMEFVYFLLDDRKLTPIGNIHRIEVARKESTLTTLSACTVVEGDAYPSVMTIWSDKRIFMLPIRCDEPTPSNIGTFVDMFVCLRVDKQLTIANVRRNCIAIYGSSTQQDGASLVLYNTIYHFVSCKHQFKVHLDNCRLWVIGKYMFMAVNRRLTCFQFKISQDKLSDLLGSKRSTEFRGTVDKDGINEESELEEGVSFNKGAKPNSDRCVRLRTGSTTKTIVPANQNKVGEPNEPLEDFKQNLSSLYRHGIQLDIILEDFLPDLLKIRNSVHAEDQLYNNEVILYLTDLLEKYGSSETEITERVIPLLIKAKLPNELDTCLRKYTNVSDQMLAKCLRFFINMKESESKTEFLNRVLACSFNKDLIKEHLRMNLNLDNAIYILELIYRDLVADEVLIEESPQYGDSFDGDIALINWFTVILDAHYQQFLLARDPNINDMLLKWKELIESFVSGLKDLTSMTTRLQNLAAGKVKQNDNTSSKWYSVEVVKLY